MFKIMLIMLGGVMFGYLLRNKKISWIHKLVTVLIWVLLFILGVNVGTNDSIIKGLPVIGLDALIITIGAVIGSLLASWALWVWINKSKKNHEG